MGISDRPGGGRRPDRSGATVVLDRVLMRIEAMPFPNGSYNKTVDGIPFGHGTIFKTYPEGNKWVVKNSVFLIEGHTHAGLTQNFENITACSNNIIIWLGEGSFPGALPSCFEVVTDVGVWQAAVAEWHARHRRVGAVRKPQSDAMDQVTGECLP